MGKVPELFLAKKEVIDLGTGEADIMQRAIHNFAPVTIFF
ncbi:MAG: hypothetical protein JETT_0430 [Candidatus Jettenia ecosi]|uniref:Uncharacterized protein n=1 Tax=Candidatus Jettenia ecosi TaxID=2494326 RepID=A0A533QKG0_9BACT|nr:MAG: hypothetical protein JETT_0430 [Candidatus Jettenia ecosi]